MKYNYCIKHEKVREECTFFDYENVFTHERLQFLRDDVNDPFGEASFEGSNSIKCSGDYVANFIPHIKRLMSHNSDGSEFTHLQIYLNVDDIVDCNVTLSTACTPLSAILNFVYTLSVNVDMRFINELTFCFTRPDFDSLEFTLESAI